MIPVVSVVARSKVGKTTLVVKIVKELKQRGYRVATIKHDVHGFEIDHPGKDTWLHAQAGADIVVISSSEKMAMIEKVDQEMTLDDVVARIDQVDIIITEGYKRAGKAKIEVFRAPRSTELVSDPRELIALVTNIPMGIGVPEFGLDDAVGVVDLMENLYLNKG